MAALMTTTAAAVVLFPAPALAQVVSEIRSFDIPAQALPDALVLFGRQAGLEVSAESANTRERTTQGVSGSFAPGDALSRLLAGTGLTYRWTSDRALIVETGPQISEDGAVTLGPVRVQGEGSGRGGGTVRQPADTRGTYTVPVTSSATKLDLAIKDTPQIVNVITRQRIEDQNLTQVADVLANAPGITVQQQGVPGAGRIQYFSRGFPVTNVMLDGVATTGAANRDFDLWSSLDTAIYDRVELVQGSTGLATGAGDPSGSVNFVRKRPTEELLAEGKISYGTWQRWRVEGDVAGPLNASGSVRGRIVGAHQQGDTWQDRVKTKMSTLYGIVEADATDDLSLTAGLLWTKIRADDAAPFGMTPVSIYNGVPFSTADLGRSFNNATQWSFTEIEMLNPFAKAEWRFAEDWRINVNYMYSKISHERLYGAIGERNYSAAAGRADYSFGHVNVDGDIHNVDAQISGKFHLFGREHDLTAGFSGYWGEIYNPIYMPIGTGGAATEMDLSNWNNGDVPFPTMGMPEFLPGVSNPFNDLLNCVCSYSRMKEKQYAGYFGARLRPIDRVSFVLGGRVNRWERGGLSWLPDITSLFAPPYELALIPDPTTKYNAKISGKFTPYAGILFDVTNNVTVYASYARSEKANVDWETSLWYVDANGDPLPAIQGNTVEIGAKATFFDDRLNIQLVGYRMKQKNRAEYADDTPPVGGCFPNPLNPFGASCPMVPGKGGISEGIDFSLSGRIGPRVNLSASYSYLEQSNSEIRSGTSKTCLADPGANAEIGFTCPKHTIKIFGTYAPVEDLTVGGGVIWKSATRSSFTVPSTGESPYSGRDQGSYAVVDLMARYRINRQIALSANVYNLFDKKYLTSSSTNSGFWGAPRNVMLSLGFRY